MTVVLPTNVRPVMAVGVSGPSAPLTTARTLKLFSTSPYWARSSSTRLMVIVPARVRFKVTSVADASPSGNSRSKSSGTRTGSKEGSRLARRVPDIAAPQFSPISDCLISDYTRSCLRWQGANSAKAWDDTRPTRVKP